MLSSMFSSLAKSKVASKSTSEKSELKAEQKPELFHFFILHTEEDRESKHPFRLGIANLTTLLDTASKGGHISISNMQFNEGQFFYCSNLAYTRQLELPEYKGNRNIACTGTTKAFVITARITPDLKQKIHDYVTSKLEEQRAKRQTTAQNTFFIEFEKIEEGLSKRLQIEAVYGATTNGSDPVVSTVQNRKVYISETLLTNEPLLTRYLEGLYTLRTFADYDKGERFANINIPYTSFNPKTKQAKPFEARCFTFKYASSEQLGQEAKQQGLKSAKDSILQPITSLPRVVIPRLEEVEKTKLLHVIAFLKLDADPSQLLQYTGKVEIPQTYFNPDYIKQPKRVLFQKTTSLAAAKARAKEQPEQAFVITCVLDSDELAGAYITAKNAAMSSKSECATFNLPTGCQILGIYDARKTRLLLPSVYAGTDSEQMYAEYQDCLSGLGHLGDIDEADTIFSAGIQAQLLKPQSLASAQTAEAESKDVKDAKESKRELVPASAVYPSLDSAKSKEKEKLNYRLGADIVLFINELQKQESAESTVLLTVQPHFCINPFDSNKLLLNLELTPSTLLHPKPGEREMIFLIDNSGSMAGILPQILNKLADLLQKKTRSNPKISVVAYNGSVRIVVNKQHLWERKDSSRKNLLEDLIKPAILGVVSEGSTDHAAGFRTALGLITSGKEQLTEFYWLSDGDGADPMPVIRQMIPDPARKKPIFYLRGLGSGYAPELFEAASGYLGVAFKHITDIEEIAEDFNQISQAQGQTPSLSLSTRLVQEAQQQTLLNQDLGMMDAGKTVDLQYNVSGLDDIASIQVECKDTHQSIVPLKQEATGAASQLVLPRSQIKIEAFNERAWLKFFTGEYLQIIDAESSSLVDKLQKLTALISNIEMKKVPGRPQPTIDELLDTIKGDAVKIQEEVHRQQQEELRGQQEELRRHTAASASTTRHQTAIPMVAAAIIESTIPFAAPNKVDAHTHASKKSSYRIVDRYRSHADIENKKQKASAPDVAVSTATTIAPMFFGKPPAKTLTATPALPSAPNVSATASALPATNSAIEAKCLATSSVTDQPPALPTSAPPPLPSTLPPTTSSATEATAASATSSDEAKASASLASAPPPMPKTLPQASQVPATLFPPAATPQATATSTAQPKKPHRRIRMGKVVLVTT